MLQDQVECTHEHVVESPRHVISGIPYGGRRLCLDCGLHEDLGTERTYALITTDPERMMFHSSLKALQRERFGGSAAAPAATPG